MASWSLVLAALVVGITVCAAIGYIVFLQPNPESNVPDLPPSDAVMETPPDETSSKHMTKPQQRSWWFTKRTIIAFGWRFNNRAIIAFGLLLCVALAVGGAYLLRLLEVVGLLH